MEPLLSYFKGVWFNPRTTIRSIVDTDSQYMMFAIILFISATSTFTLPSSTSVWLLPVAFVVMVIFFVAFLYLSAFLMSWTGKWLNGQSTQEELRTAYLWASIPTGTGYALAIVITLLTTGNLLGVEDQIASSLIILITSAWTLVIYVLMVAELQKFSLWKAILNLMFVVVSFLMIVIVISFVVSVLI